MTLEEFKDVYHDKTPVEMLKLMAVQFDYWRHDAIDRAVASLRGNHNDAVYYSNECMAMEERVRWLMDNIVQALEDTHKTPTVLSLQEVESFATNTNLYEWLWIEEKQQVTWSLHCMRAFVYSKHPDTQGFYIMANAYHDIVKLEGDEYNVTWRVWDKRPSDVQRRTIPWKN